MTIKREQIRDGAIDNSKIAVNAEIDTTKLTLSTEFLHSFHTSYAQDTTNTLVQTFDKNIHQDLPLELGTSNQPGVVVQSDSNWVRLYDSIGRIVRLCDVQVVTSNSSQYVIGKTTNLQPTASLVNITGVELGYIGGENSSSILTFIAQDESLVWDNGDPVVVSSNGLYTLVGSSQDKIVVEVISNDLPSVDESDTISFTSQENTSQYCVGLFYVDTSTGDLVPIKPNIISDVRFLLPIVYSIDQIPFNAFSSALELERGESISVDFSSIVDVTKTVGTELLTTQSLSSQEVASSGASKVGVFLPRTSTGSTLQALLDQLDSRVLERGRESVLATSPYVVQNGANIEVTISSCGGSLIGASAAQLSTVVQNTLMTIHNGVILHPAKYQHSLIASVYKIIVLDKILVGTDSFDFLFDWLPV